MAFRIESEPLPGLKIIQSDLYGDDRGFFMEVYRSDRFDALGLPSEFLQDNFSRSKKHVLRGLHFQWDPPQGKLVRVVAGKAFLAIADIRKNSPTLGKWFGREFGNGDGFQVWVPPGFANGFCALSDVVEIQYKCTAHYNPSAEGVIRWDDPVIGIRWPVEQPVLSPKDANAHTLREWLSLPQSASFTFGR